LRRVTARDRDDVAGAGPPSTLATRRREHRRRSVGEQRPAGYDLGIGRFRPAIGAGALVVALAAGACGGSAGSPAATTRASTARPAAPELLHLKRITAVADPMVDELDVQRDGAVSYHVIYGGRDGKLTSSTRLGAGQLARLRRMVATTQRTRPIAPRHAPRPGGYLYVLRLGHRTFGAASGHIGHALRPLLARLDRIIDGRQPHLVGERG
jgi:hypothetical protein